MLLAGMEFEEKKILIKIIFNIFFSIFLIKKKNYGGDIISIIISFLYNVYVIP